MVDRNSRLVALVYFDRDKMAADGMAPDAVSSVAETVMAEANRSLPAYSRISKVEVMDTPFEKTPKMSIRRFLYK